MSTLLHIASVVVQHHTDAASLLDRALASLPGVELALREGGRSVVLCESTDEGGLMDRMESLRGVEGVIGVNLVHHHAEDANVLYEEVADGHAP